MEKNEQAYDFWKRVDQCNTKSVKDMADSTGIDYGRIRQSRTLVRMPSCMDAYAIAKYLNVSMEYLLDGSEDNKYQEYFAYLEKADKWQIAAVRRILEMPDLKDENESENRGF